MSADLYKYWQVDFQNGTIKIVCQDGRVLEEDLEPKFRERDSQVAISIFDWERWWISATPERPALRLSGSESLADCL